ncbi:hypothetical protein QMK17_08140 [Rhodococcus sp. G-MC3]|uniref:hypothetical protein n=1 Tax=Rhodococcus sp. G-MC3 TaxID=3046209 RepID=UPI0024B9A60E|nr:hypothetical protein [Rhodococcus sp. G-MC3]MDJ0393300.1 hypothetical protein [Rhodococcus sp. G-MC3]
MADRRLFTPVFDNMSTSLLDSGKPGAPPDWYCSIPTHPLPFCSQGVPTFDDEAFSTRDLVSSRTEKPDSNS